MKTFENLLKSEIRKAEKFANHLTDRNDCRVTGYYWDGKIDDLGFISVKCEICCNDMQERINKDVYLSIPLWNRRQSFACCIYTHCSL